MRIDSRNEGDTVRLLEGRFAAADKVQSGFTQGARAGGARRVLQLARGHAACDHSPEFVVHHQELADRPAPPEAGAPAVCAAAPFPEPETRGLFRGDRKSTRLNSSHVEISYAVFCLK